MTTEITIKCCEGNETYDGHCLRDRCPIYKDASVAVNESWPYTGTGFGNLWGNPHHHNYLDKVRQDIQNESKKVE